MTSKQKKPACHVNVRFLLSSPAYFFSMGLGSGLARWAPGTWGTLVALPLYALLHVWLSREGIAILCVPMFFLGVWSTHRTLTKLHIHDYSGIVIDEIVAMCFVLTMIPFSIISWTSAFVLFRCFDIFKPWPIYWLDQHLLNSFGVMLDDLCAAFYTILTLQFIGMMWPRFLI